MERTNVRYFLSACMLFVCIQTGTCLECYTCATPKKELCGDNFSPFRTTPQQCRPSENLCFKSSIKVLEEVVITRACGNEHSCHLYDTCSTCDKDLCNSSTHVVPTIVLNGLLALALTKFY